LLGSLERFTVATVELTAAQMRGVLTAEGVFRNMASADPETLDMCWRARQSPEYQDCRPADYLPPPPALTYEAQRPDNWSGHSLPQTRHLWVSPGSRIPGPRTTSLGVSVDPQSGQR
jgi:hypothetical protein